MEFHCLTLKDLMWSQQIHVKIFAYHLSTSRGKLRNWSPELSNFPTIKESRFIFLDSSACSREQCTGFILRKHRRFFLPGRHRKIESRIWRLRNRKSTDRSGKYYEALHTFISKKSSLLPRKLWWKCKAKKKRMRSLSEQYSAVS